MDRLTQARVLLDRLKSAGEEELPDRLQMARIDCETGILPTFLGQYTQAAACFDRVLPIADAFQDQQLAAMTRMMYGRKLWFEGQIARAITMLEPSIPALERQIGMG